MLEIFGLIMLCKANKKNALARGKKPGGFIALTIILWVGLELLGFFIGTLSEIEYGYFIFGYGFAGIGALISFLCAKFGPKGDYVDPKAQQTLDANAPVIGDYNVPVDDSAYAPAQPAAPVQQQKFCNSCGSPVPDGCKYCDKCGAPVV